MEKKEAVLAEIQADLSKLDLPKPVVSERQEKVPDQMVQANVVQQLVNEEDLLIKQLIDEQKEKDFPKAETVSMHWEPHQSMFVLPNSAQKVLDKFAFVWVEVDPRMLRMYQRDGWQIVNRTKCPWFKSREFSTSGAIERHGYSRHLLMYMPKDVRTAIDRAVENKNNQASRNLDKSDDPRFYMSAIGEDSEPPNFGVHHQVGAVVSENADNFGE